MSLLAADTVVNNRYRVLRLIGRGGQGAVYEALDLTFQIHVALKQLLPVGEHATQQLERFSAQFELEAQTLAMLRHPALPRVTDRFTIPVGQFLVMDYVSGDDLGTLLL